ncbi:hypothetical protein P6709_11045 [Jeotgalibacillus sp. ET6]|uniref:hypothetical protein n=1 Tax=Jeotgalibacillus sp. ET6 TaxID=3037260 RepID=UPI002418AF5F|nr:hypothetical protein [Jeotgalibacillus sp. ET6]MDG5472291.1 hypothetical protein [Jeotgalibacillus sp. ET6]
MVDQLALVLGWGIILLFALRLYKKKEENDVSIWKAVIAIAVGLFSFSINFPVFGEIIGLPIFPLGVWMLIFLLRKRESSWHRYRAFAWLGFGANFVFLILTLLTIPAQSLIYPENQLTTYISKIDDASLIALHPSAGSSTLNKEIFGEQLEKSNPKSVQSEEWYYETEVDQEIEDRSERFPYQLAGVSAKWGSGFSSIVYIEEDGKGFLVTNGAEQRYFRTDQSILQGGEN